MATVRDLINGAMRLIGAKASGEALSASEAADGLEALNALVESWSTESLMVYTITRTEFDLVPTQQAYTLGPGGDFNIPRPVWIENASILLTSSTPHAEIPISILRDEQWQDVTTKDTDSTFPVLVYPDGGYPFNTLSFWPIPTTVNKVVLYTPALLSAFADINATVSFPPGYERALRYNLAVELAPEYGLEASPSVQRIAFASKGVLASRNFTPMEMTCDSALVGRGRATIADKSRGYVVDP